MSKIAQMWGEENATGMKLRRHERLWRAAYKELDQEKGLSPAAIELLDVLNAFVRMTRQSEKSLAQAYVTMGVHARMLDDVSIKLWDKAIRAEYNHLQDPDLDADEFSIRFKHSWHFHFFANESDAFHDTFYLSFSRNVRLLSNVIRMTGAKDRDGKPLIFAQRQRDLLQPHYNVYEEMSDDDRLESVGVMRLHHAWKTTDDGERQKIKRFVTAHADEMDSVIALVESRYVDSLDHLETLMMSSASPALMEGVL
jgi:hypothetical protein